MRFTRRGQLLTLALLTASGSILAAENLPPLRIDPALLAAPIPQAVPAAPSVKSAPTVEPVRVVQPAQTTQPASPPTLAAQPQATLPSPEALRPQAVQPAQAVVPPQTVVQTQAAAISLPPQVEERKPLPALYSAHVQAGLLPEPALKSSSVLVPLAKDSEDVRPTFISADRMSGKNDVESVALGNVELRKIGKVLTTDQLTYWGNEDEVEAVGKVELYMDQDRMSGQKLRLKLGDSVGYFDAPQYSIKRPAHSLVPLKPGEPVPLITGAGHARRIDFQGEDHYRLTDATYSTCGPNDPEWYVHADSMTLDYEREVAKASDASLIFKGMPILYSPWLDFSLNNQRKSGFLSPNVATTTRSGLEVSLPYFWNIAPNMDATVSPRLMAKRGVQLGGEFRYLDFNYNGLMRGEILPNDNVTHKDRSSLSLQHLQNFGSGFSGSLDLNRVSDDTYYADLASRLAVTSQTNLLRQGTLSYGSSWWNASIIAQRFQTLQDPAAAPVVIPYYRLPQLTLNANRADFPLGSAFSFSGEYVNFSHPTLVLGKRSTLYPQISLPLQTAAFYVTPKIGLHSTTYSLERQDPGVPDRITRNVPVVSIDSGVVFERNIDWLGTSMTQTLEPRLYYLYAAKREQSQIPIFDSGLADFNFAQIFSENRYSGGDRFGDANQITAALTSRLVDPASGAELVRGLIGQRYYFNQQQQVTLPGEIVRTSKAADFLAALSGQVLPKTSIDTAIQYSLQDNRTNRLTINGRYQPELGKVINAGFRFNRDLLNPVTQVNQIKQFDISGQWPLGGGWYGVGRYNFSLIDGSLIEAMGGLEYSGDCWVARIVMQRIATGATTSSTGLFLQLELNGFASIGSNPMDILKRNIPGFSRINQPVENISQ